jgi:Na+-driven multidrug efflux pump
MKIDWAALGIVAIVSIIATLIFVALLSGGIRYISQATVAANQSQPSAAVRTVGYLLIGLAGLVVIFGIWLIVPQFH